MLCLTPVMKLLIDCFYRPPNSDADYLQGLLDIFERTNNTGITKVLILGDFNFPSIDWVTYNSPDCSASSFIDKLHDLFWSQLNFLATRYANDAGAVLDLLITSTPEYVKEIVCLPDEFPSDHLLMKCCFAIPAKRVKPIKRIVYNYKTADMNELHNLMRKCPLGSMF